jgi:hypothetical protein
MCDQISTPADNQALSFFGTHLRPSSFALLRKLEGVESPGVSVMSSIPLHLKRRCEQRWAARFARQAPAPSSGKSEREKHGQPLGAPAKAKRKTRRAGPAGLKSGR